MIKNASLKDNQNLLKFLPKILDNQNFHFEDVANDLAIGGETFEAMKMFDETVRQMQRQGDDANDFMRKIVQSNEGFADANEQMAPLKQFYVLIPAVSTSQVEYVVNGRNKLKQRDNKEAFISDDGFPLGLAFLLRILGINEEFNGLNWFASVETKLNKEIELNQKRFARAQEKEASRPKNEVARKLHSYEQEDNEEEEQLSIKQKESEKEEYQLLSYTLTTSAILFKEI